MLEKIHLLSEDPMPDAKVKKQLKYMNDRFHGIRSGNFRIFYTFEKPYISILALRRRDYDTYDEDLDAEFLGGLDPQFEETKTSKIMQPDWEKYVTEQKKPLPEPITEELLTRLHLPCEYHARLIRVHTQDDLLNCPGVPDDYLLLIDQCMFERPLVQVLQQPDYLLNDVNDLFLYLSHKMACIYQELLLEGQHLLPYKMVNPSTVDIGIFLYYTGFELVLTLKSHELLPKKILKNLRRSSKMMQFDTHKMHYMRTQRGYA